MSAEILSLEPAATPAKRPRLVSDPYFIAGSTILLLIIALTAAAPLITSISPNEIDLLNLEAAPSAAHWLGTDELGRDVLSRLLYGGRISVLVGIAAVVVQVLIGVTLGAVAGYFGGKTDILIMRLTEAVMCFPFYAIAITLAAIFGASIWNVIIIIGALNWTGLARLIRAEFLSLREREFALAARAMGVGSLTIIVRHLLANAYGPLLVYATLAVANGILAEAALSFLGLGVRQPDPSWGNLLSAAQSMRVLSYCWWLWVPPGIAIILMVLAINLIGEALSKSFNPQSSATLRDMQSKPNQTTKANAS